MKGMRARIWASVAVAGATIAGLAGAHAIDYLLVFRDSATRAHVLAQSGHSYFSSFVATALLGAFLASAVVLCVGWSSGRGRDGVTFTGRALFTRLVGLQMVGFLVLEVGERLSVGLPAHHLLTPVLPLGLLLQVATAALGTAIVLMLYRVARAIARATRAEPGAQVRPLVLIPAAQCAPSVAIPAEPYAPRGPPLANVA